MATIVNARDVALQATDPRVVPVQLPTNVTVGSGNLTDELEARIIDAPTVGLVGTRTGVMDMYAWSDTYPTIRPSGTSTFTWSTGQFTAPDNIQIDDADFSSVSLMLHFDGANNSTTVTDSSMVPKTGTAMGNAKISTTQYKFGGASGYFDGSGDYVEFANNSAFAMGAGDFTIEMWAYPDTVSGAHALIGYANGSAANTNYSFQLLQNAAQWQLNAFSGSTVYGSAAGTASVNTQHHVALVRHGANLIAYINGIAVQTTAVGVNGLNDPSGAVLQIGQVQGYYPFSGYIDELRITKGLARYTADFTPQTAAFGHSQWSLFPGADVVGKALYIVRNPTGNNESAATSAVDWDASAPVEIKAIGLASTRTAALEVYQWALTEPTVFPSGTSTYTWSNGAFTAPGTPAGWSVLPGASLPGGTLYACRVTYDDATADLTTVVTWPGSNTAHAIAATSVVGSRGNRRIISTDAGYNSGYTYGGNAAGADSFAAKATDLIAAAVGDALPSTPINGDEVVFANGTTFVYVITHTGSAWAPPGLVLDGSLLVTGSVTAAAMDALGLRVGTGGLVAATGYPGISLDGSTPAAAGADLAGARFGLNATGFAHVDTLLCWGQIFTHSVGAQASVGSPVVFGNNLSSGPGVKGASASGEGGLFAGNATRGHIRLDPLSGLPSDATLGQIVCLADGTYRVSTGSGWKTITIV